MSACRPLSRRLIGLSGGSSSAAVLARCAASSAGGTPAQLSQLKSPPLISTLGACSALTNFCALPDYLRRYCAECCWVRCSVRCWGSLQPSVQEMWTMCPGSAATHAERPASQRASGLDLSNLSSKASSYMLCRCAETVIQGETPAISRICQKRLTVRPRVKRVVF